VHAGSDDRSPLRGFLVRSSLADVLVDGN